MAGVSTPRGVPAGGGCRSGADPGGGAALAGGGDRAGKGPRPPIGRPGWAGPLAVGVGGTAGDREPLLGWGRSRPFREPEGVGEDSGRPSQDRLSPVPARPAAGAGKARGPADPGRRPSPPEVRAGGGVRPGVRGRPGPGSGPAGGAGEGVGRRGGAGGGVTEIGFAVRGRGGKLLAPLPGRSVTTIVVEPRDRLARFGAEHVEAALEAPGRRPPVPLRDR